MSARRFNEADVVGEFADALAAAGFRLRASPIMDGVWHRAAVDGDKGAEQSGRYRGYLDGIRPAGFVENFRDATRTGLWKAGAAPPVLSAAEREAYRRAAAAAEAQREQERSARLATIAAEAAAEWQGAAPAPTTHPYLARKRVLSHEVRINKVGNLLVPMRDFDGQIHSLQRIAADGTKRFPEGGRVIGLHMLLGSLAPGATLLITEGFATGATLHQVTGYAVAVAFSKTNFVGIARTYGERFPGLRIAFCGDNDHHHPRRPKPLSNVGKVAAEEAAQDAGGVAILPHFKSHDTGSDWNDYEELHGPDAVRAAIEAGFPPPPPPPLLPHYPAPAGTREEAIAALPRAAGAFFDDAERSIAIRQVWQTRQAEIEATYLPKSRERRAALREARRDMVAQYGKEWRAPGRRLLLPAAAGTGKTKLAAQDIARRMPTLGNVFFATDKLENASAVAAQIPGAAIIRGRSRPDPKSTDGRKMCWRSKAAEAVARAGLPVARALCRDDEGKVCPFFSSCGYQREAARMRAGDVTVFCGSHEYLTLHAPMPKPDVVVIDESCVGTLIGRVEFGLDRLLPDAMPNWQATGPELAADYRRIMVMVSDAIRSRGDILAALRQEGIAQPDHLAPAIQYIRAVEAQEFTAGISPDMDDAQVVDLLERHQRSEIGNVLKMLTALQDEIILPRDQAHGVAFHPNKPVKVDGQMERQARVTVHYRKRLAFAADLPVLVLDASGDAEVYRRLLGDRLEVAAAVRCERNAEVVQIRDMPMPRTTLLGADRKGNPLSPTRVARATRLRAEVVAVADALAARHGSLMLATNKPVEAALLPALGEAVATGHFGALRGKNDYEGCAAGLLLGREQTWPQVAEDAARAIWATDPDPLQLPGTYAKATRGIRMRDGSAVAVSVDVHLDPRVQRMVELHRERESEQAADRLRLIHNAKPKTLYIASNLPLDMTVDRAVTWRELVRDATGQMDNGKQGSGRRIYGNRLEEAYRQAGDVLPLSRGTLMRLFGPEGQLKPGIWASERAIGDDLAKGADSASNTLKAESAPFPPVLVRYRTQGQRGSDCTALVGLPSDAGRAALAALVGPLVAYVVQGAADPPVAATAPPGAPAAEAAPLCPIAVPEAPVMPAPVAAPSPAARLAALTARLEAMRPPTLEGDGTDMARLLAWRRRCTDQPEARRAAA